MIWQPLLIQYTKHKSLRWIIVWAIFLLLWLLLYSKASHFSWNKNCPLMKKYLFLQWKKWLLQWYHSCYKESWKLFSFVTFLLSLKLFDSALNIETCTTFNQINVVTMPVNFTTLFWFFFYLLNYPPVWICQQCIMCMCLYSFRSIILNSSPDCWDYRCGPLPSSCGAEDESQSFMHARQALYQLSYMPILWTVSNFPKESQ